PAPPPAGRPGCGAGSRTRTWWSSATPTSRWTRRRTASGSSTPGHPAIEGGSRTGRWGCSTSTAAGWWRRPSSRSPDGFPAGRDVSHRVAGGGGRPPVGRPGGQAAPGGGGAAGHRSAGRGCPAAAVPVVVMMVVVVLGEHEGDGHHDGGGRAHLTVRLHREDGPGVLMGEVPVHPDAQPEQLQLLADLVQRLPDQRGLHDLHRGRRGWRAPRG